VTQWIVACQAPLSLGFSRQKYWSGLPFPSPGNLPDSGIKPGPPALQDSFNWTHGLKKKCYIPQPVKLNIHQYYLSPKFFSPHSLTSDIKVLTKESLSFIVVKAKTDLAFEFSFKLRWWEIKPQESQYLCQHTTQ